MRIRDNQMILAIDTTGRNCGTALWSEGLIGLLETEQGLRHNEILFGQIQTLLHKNNLSLADLSAVAVSSGPGSFTGLRVGMAAAKGLCWCREIPLIAVSTMEGLAHGAPSRTGRVLTLMPARADEVYWALFERDGKRRRRISEDRVDRVDALADLCEGELFITGEGYLKHKEALEVRFAGRMLPLKPNESVRPLAASTAELASERLWKGRFDDLMNTEPNYCYAFPRRNT